MGGVQIEIWLHTCLLYGAKEFLSGSVCLAHACIVPCCVSVCTVVSLARPSCIPFPSHNYLPPVLAFPETM